MTADALAPYLVVLLAGALPNESFRIAAVLMARGISERSWLFGWIRIVAVTLLAAVVSKIVTSPPAALGAVPTWVSMIGIASGVATFRLTGILLASILAGEAAFVLAGWLAR